MNLKHRQKKFKPLIFNEKYNELVHFPYGIK